MRSRGRRAVAGQDYCDEPHRSYALSLPSGMGLYRGFRNRFWPTVHTPFDIGSRSRHGLTHRGGPRNRPFLCDPAFNSGENLRRMGNRHSRRRRVRSISSGSVDSDLCDRLNALDLGQRRDFPPRRRLMRSLWPPMGIRNTRLSLSPLGNLGFRRGRGRDYERPSPPIAGTLRRGSFTPDLGRRIPALGGWPRPRRGFSSRRRSPYSNNIRGGWRRGFSGSDDVWSNYSSETIPTTQRSFLSTSFGSPLTSELSLDELENRRGIDGLGGFGRRRRRLPSFPGPYDVWSDDDF